MVEICMCGKIRGELKAGSKEKWLKSDKIMSLPALLYWNKNWTLIKRQERRNQRVEVELLRSVAKHEFKNPKAKEETT
jgi:hypothetical protein